MLHQQRLPDQLQHGTAIARRPAGGGQAGGERLDHVEHRVHLALVAPERDGLGERVGDHQDARRRQVAHGDGAAGRDAILVVGGDLECGGFVIHAGARTGQAQLHRVDHLVLFERRQADHHRHAETVEHHEAHGAGAEGERVGRQGVGALEARRVDPVAEQQRARREATDRVAGGLVPPGIGSGHANRSRQAS